MLNEALQHRCGQHDSRIELKSAPREEIERLTQEFLAKGGQIQEMDILQRDQSDVWSKVPAIWEGDQNTLSLDQAALFLGVMPQKLYVMCTVNASGPKCITREIGKQKFLRFTMSALREFKNMMAERRSRIENRPETVE